MTNPIPQTAKTNPPRSAKVGETTDDWRCVKCPAMNRPGVAYVYRVFDERGDHFECNVCGHAWP